MKVYVLKGYILSEENSFIMMVTTSGEKAQKAFRDTKDRPTRWYTLRVWDGDSGQLMDDDDEFCVR